MYRTLPQSVIVKSVERNAVNMYEARRFLLGLENPAGYSTSSFSSAAVSHTNAPSPSLIGLDILASAGLGLSSLGNGVFCLMFFGAWFKNISKPLL